MTSELRDHLEHPLESLVAGVRGALDQYGEGPAWTVSASRLPALLTELVQAQNALASVRLRLLREADRHQVGDPTGHANTGGWWATQTHQTKPAAHREVALAERLDDTAHEATADAMSAGAVTVDQAGVILDAVDALPEDLVGPALRRDAETRLVDLAHHHDPKELRVLGRKILDVLAPEIAEKHERQVLEREEQHAAATASFTMRPDGHGSMYGRFKIPTLAGEILAKHLAAIAAPKHRAARGTGVSPGSTSGGDAPASTPTRPLRLGAAFIEYLETRANTGLPKAGGIPATIVVTMTLSDLMGATDHPAQLDSGETITAGQARRLACEAGIIPAVLGTKSQPLDLGRKSRFHNEAQRIAIGQIDRECRAQHCDWPPGMCHIHHPIPWAKGGGTGLDGMLLCPRHHSMAHDARYQMKAGKNRKVIFTRRT